MANNTPAAMATEALNAASTNIRKALDMTVVSAPGPLMEAARLQTELAKAAALLEIGVQLQALSQIATPGASIRYGMGEVAEALRANSKE
jgi:ABC-type xylose transport system permease subunit